MAPDESVVHIEGPWKHRAVHAGGTRFHVVEAGDGPLVLLLHGFPQFWWTWRAQLESLPPAGFRAAAVDLRGYGGSDKPPRGYDLPTLAADATGLIRALGETGAIVVGHDWGGLLAWTMAVLEPKAVHRLVTVSAPHPLRMRGSLLTDPFGQLKASRSTFGFQLPLLPERRLTHDGASLSEYVGYGVPHAWTVAVLKVVEVAGISADSVGSWNPGADGCSMKSNSTQPSFWS